MDTSALIWLVVAWIATEAIAFWCGAAWATRRVRAEDAGAELRRVIREVSGARGPQELVEVLEDIRRR